MRACVPGVLYLNFIADHEYAEGLAPGAFRPAPLTADPTKTLFTILIFRLRGGRPTWAPPMLGRLAPDVWQSNWRFYGNLTTLPEGERPGVLFWRTVTDSRCLTVFGRRVARCFPVQHVQHMELRCHGREISALVQPGPGSASSLSFRGRLTDEQEVPLPFRTSFSHFVDYARWIADQHLSLTAWKDDVVVQDMHLTLDATRFINVRPDEVSVPALTGFVRDTAHPLSCFWGENLEVWLDSIRALPRR